MDELTMYTANWCPDCRRVKNFLKDRGIAFQEVNIEENEEAEALVIRVNHGKRKVPTLKLGERFFACSPFNSQQLADELRIPLNVPKH